MTAGQQTYLAFSVGPPTELPGSATLTATRYSPIYDLSNSGTPSFPLSPYADAGNRVAYLMSVVYPTMLSHVSSEWPSGVIPYFNAAFQVAVWGVATGQNQSTSIFADVNLGGLLLTTYTTAASRQGLANLLIQQLNTAEVNADVQGVIRITSILTMLQGTFSPVRGAGPVQTIGAGDDFGSLFSGYDPSQHYGSDVSLFAIDRSTGSGYPDLVAVPTAVPEPSTLVLLALGTTALAVAWKLRSR